MERLLEEQRAVAAGDSPSRYDIDFFRRKNSRLEGELESAHQELTAIRVRLRRAEDFQIKCEYLARDIAALESEQTVLMAENNQLKLDNEALLRGVEEELAAKNGLYSELTVALNEGEAWRQRFEQLERRGKYELEVARSSFELNSSQTAEQVRSESAKTQLQLRHDMQLLRTELARAQQPPPQLAVLRGRNRELEQQLERMKAGVEQKEQQEEARLSGESLQKETHLKQKYDEGLRELEGVFSRREQISGQEIAQLRGLVQVKNKEVEDLMRTQEQSKAFYEGQLIVLRERVQELEGELFEARRVGELELGEVKETMQNGGRAVKEGSQRVQEQQRRQLQAQYQRLLDIVREKEKELEGVRESMQQLSRCHQQELKLKAEQLEQQAKFAREDREQLQRDQNSLNGTLRNLEQGQGSRSLEYQNNLVFLNNQLQRALTVNETKNREVASLYQEINEIRQENHDIINQLQQRIREEKRSHRETLEDAQAREGAALAVRQQKELEWRSRLRELEGRVRVGEEERQKQRLLIESLQANYKGLIQQAREIERSLRGEKQKLSVSMIEMDSTRREKFNELDKMKIDYEAIRRAEIDAIRDSLKQEIDRKSEAVLRLKHEALDREQALRECQIQLGQLPGHAGARPAQLAAVRDLAEHNLAVLQNLR